MADMSQYLRISLTICLIIVQLTFLGIVSADYSPISSNATGESQHKIDISRRSSPNEIPLVLKINVKLKKIVKTTSPSGEEIRHQYEEIVSLKWQRQPNVLANEHLPVTWSNGDSIPNVMRDIGDFELYHDYEKCSAVIYYVKSKKMSGFIGTEYVLADLPTEFFDRNGNHVRGNPQKYILSYHMITEDMESPEILHGSNGDSLSQSNDVSDESSSDASDFGAGPSRKRPRIEQPIMQGLGVMKPSPGFSYIYHHFLEILVLVPRDVTDNFKEAFEDEYIQAIVKETLKDFNAIGMMMKKIHAGPETININLAGIVMIPSLSQPGSDVVEFREAVMKIRNYLNDHRDIHPPDSFDYVFVTTSRTLKDGDKFIHGNTAGGGPDLYVQRHRHNSNTAIPISVIGNFPFNVATNEILKMFNIEDKKCYMTAQNEIACGYCSNKLPEVNMLLYNFFSANPNRCFLQNEPRSLRPPGPSIFLTPLQQCRCFGFNTYYRGGSRRAVGYVLMDECDKSLPCTEMTERALHEFTLKPFDGTRCAGKRHKVCWKQKCVDILH